ncbi:MAG: DNA-directed RNA polymerase [Candidatus Aenigmatarchaeota archaeon]
MYRILTVEDKIRVPPEKLGMSVNQSVKEALAEKFEGMLDSRLGVILTVVAVEKVGEGSIVPEDPGVHYKTQFKLLTFKPELHELVNGLVIDNTEFGCFVSIGPIDGLVHISQLMDDFVSFDSRHSTFIGRETKKQLKEGDQVRGRIISISWGEKNKIGLTMRQPYLGSLIWIEEEKKKGKKKSEKTEK